MSTQRGNVKKSKPKHQNEFAFKHNPKSRKTAHIASLPVYGVCPRCHDQLEWRKKYRKYKPLTKPATCIECHQKKITHAYHMLCMDCTRDKKCCAKCGTPSANIKEKAVKNKQQTQNELEETLYGLREREKRTVLRKLQREAEEENGEENDEQEEEEESALMEDEA